MTDLAAQTRQGFEAVIGWGVSPFPVMTTDEHAVAALAQRMAEWLDHCS